MPKPETVARRCDKVDEEYRRRARALVEHYGVATLWEVPREERRKLWAWGTAAHRRARGLDPKTGEPNEQTKRERRREYRRKRREERANG